MLKTIKKVDEETWARFKSLSARKRINMGNLLKLMVDEYECKSMEFWNIILKGEKILLDEESADMKRLLTKVRKESGFRI